MSRYQRRGEPGDQRATPLELFYDLVFVFAVTQVSHLLLSDLTWAGAAQAFLILLVIWWSWNYTTWAMNELDPESNAVRLMLIGVMLASMLMAIAIPSAFGEQALLFVLAYVAIQVGRHTFLTFVAGGPGSTERDRAGRILVWFVVTGALWIGGALEHGPVRVVFWVAALAIDYTAPLFLYWVPWLPRLQSSTWAISTEHFAERFQLFVIIALGESIVITGATTSDLDLGTASLLAFGLAFVGTAALWWLYFDYTATIAARRLALAENSTALARDAYTYLHVFLVGSIIVAAVGDELVIAHPSEPLSGPELVAVAAGPALYLLTHVVLRLRMARSVSGRRLGGALACVGVGLLGGALPALAVAARLVAILIAVIVSEQIAGTRRRQRGEAAPLEKLELG